MAVCTCGAVFDIYEDDGVPGCCSVETVDCPYCGREVARHFGTCECRGISDANVCDELKEIRVRYDKIVDAYVKTHGYNWGTDEYSQIIKQWRAEVDAVLKRQGKAPSGNVR